MASIKPGIIRTVQNISRRVTGVRRRRKRFLSFFFFFLQTLPWMSHLRRHKPDQKELYKSTLFGCEKTHARILAHTQTLMQEDTHAHTQTLSQTERSEL